MEVLEIQETYEKLQLLPHYSSQGLKYGFHSHMPHVMGVKSILYLCFGKYYDYCFLLDG